VAFHVVSDMGRTSFQTEISNQEIPHNNLAKEAEEVRFEDKVPLPPL